MTNQEKTKIRELRELGYGYKRIAREVDVPLSTIRYICSLSEEKGTVGVCLNCGNETVSLSHKKMKRFCCDKCRYTWWNEHNKQVKKHD